MILVHLASYLPKLPRLLSSQPADRARELLAARVTRWLLLSPRWLPDLSSRC